MNEFGVAVTIKKQIDKNDDTVHLEDMSIKCTIEMWTIQYDLNAINISI